MQVAVFLVPAEQQEANEFLRTHKPEGQVHFNKDTIVVFYDTGEVSPEYRIAEYRELLRSNENATFQQELALYVMQQQLADLKEERSQLKTGSNKGRVEEIDNLISQITSGIVNGKQAIAMQGIKADFVNMKIAELQSKAE